MSVLLGCASNAEKLVARADREEERTALPGTASMLLSAMPKIPDFPDFPLGLDWGYDYSSGLYTLPEKDADRILDYRDNCIPRYEVELRLYQEEVAGIVERISAMNL